MQIKKQWKKIVTVVLVAAALAGALVFLMPLLLPFLLGYLIASVTAPVARRLQDKTSLPRWLCSSLSITVLFLILGAALYFLLRSLYGELTGLVQQLPEMLSGLEQPAARLRSWLEGLASKAPNGLSASFRSWIDSFFRGSSGFVETLYHWLVGLVSTIVSKAPGFFLGLMTTILSTYMIAANLPEIRRWLSNRLPEKWRTTLSQIRNRCYTALAGWFKAQGKLLLIVFAIVSLGLWILGVDFFLLLGALIALFDALPVFGAGMILIPWALISFLQSDTRMGFGLIILYGVEALTRSALEPRLVGRQIGLHPLATLLAFYVGYRLMGVLGMILFPIASILIKQLFELFSAPQANTKKG